MTRYILGILALLTSTPAALAQAWLGENLVPNAGSEDVAQDSGKAQNWRTITHGGSPVVRADAQGALTGRQSLRLDLAQSPAHVTV